MSAGSCSITLKELTEELEDFSVTVTDDNALRELMTLGSAYRLKKTRLVAEWVSFSNNKKCPLDSANVEKFGSQLKQSRTKTTPTSNKSVRMTPKVYTKDELHELFGGSTNKTDADYEEEENIDLINTYAGATPTRTPRGSKRPITSPVTPRPKLKPLGTTPTTAFSETLSPSNHSSPSSAYLTDTPSGKYSARTNKGRVTCAHNANILMHRLAEPRHTHITLYGVTPYTCALRHMYVKISEQATVLKDRLEDIGELICKYNQLETSDELSESPPVIVGMVACEGEGGRLNTSSCLLQVIVSGKRDMASTLELFIPQDFHQPCSLFPGQVIAVEGQLCEQSKKLVASRIFDEGCVPPSPHISNTVETIQGFTMVMASGPYTTSDNLDMTPLHDLLSIVSKERPSVLLLMGPFLDACHEDVLNWSLSESFNEFVERHILSPIVKTCRGSNSKVIIVPSQRDIAHPWTVYPQPPFTFDKDITELLSDVTFVSDPSVVTVNGAHIGVSSTDILFHLNTQALFLGPNLDRMSKLVSHVIRQQSFYPLYPPYCRETDSVSSDCTPYADGGAEINFDLRLAYESGHASLPILPDILVLTSDLKPFVKNVDGCLCVNVGHLTKKAGGGTYSHVLVNNTEPKDLPSNTGIQIICI